MSPSDVATHVECLPLVSIVTPSYNQAQFLEQTIVSVLSQDYPHIEYLIVDGGSTDGSVDIIKKYSERLAYWVSEPDRGQAHAINKGWQRATGEIVAYLNSDDLYTPGAVTAAVQALLEHPDAGMVCADANLIDAQGTVTREWKGRPFDIQQVITSEGFVRQPTVFIRRSALAAVGLLDERLHMSMDYDLWVRIGLRFPVVYLADTCVAQAREHPGAKSTARIADFPNDRRRTLNKVYHDKRGVPRELQGLRPTAYAAVSFTQAVLNAYVGRPGEIMRPLLRAFVESPMYVLRRPLPTAGLIARRCMPYWSGQAPAPVIAVWRRITPDK